MDWGIVTVIGDLILIALLLGKACSQWRNQRTTPRAADEER